MRVDGDECTHGQGGEHAVVARDEDGDGGFAGDRGEVRGPAAFHGDDALHAVEDARQRGAEAGRDQHRAGWKVADVGA